jgi:indole-3-acetate monooxygenase
MTARDPVYVAKLVGEVDRLAPLVRQYRDSFDRERHLPDAVAGALADAGLLKLWLPKAFGGPELSPLDFMEVVEAASALDGSVGWIVGNGGGMSRAAGYLPEEVAREWFADARCFVVAATGAIGTAVQAPGGYRVSGRWPFGSGAHQATRFMGLCGVDGDAAGGPPQVIACHFAPSDVALLDTWHVSGLRGTGSCDFEVRDVFVPASHTYAFPDHKPSQPGLLYRMPSVSVFAWTVSVVPLGIARGMFATFAELADRKARLGSTLPLAERELVQSEVGRAETLHHAARSGLVAAMEELMAATDAGGERLVRARARFRAACSFTAESAVRIADGLAALAGTAAIFENGTLERAVRDVHAAVKHVAMNPNNYVVFGRISLGKEPGTSRF